MLDAASWDHQFCARCLLAAAAHRGSEVESDVADDSGFDTPAPAGGTGVASWAVESDTVLSDRYRLIERIGHGGMGEVWRAEQLLPVRRIVAVKLIRAGMDSEQVLRRFEAERQALAMMGHPNVARVFDAGVGPHGRPYFVMEYVIGEAITAYCDRHRLSTAERLGLVLDVCSGVEHAHQKGIIHRDIKPTNVLVAVEDGRPVPKLIDFGVAKAIARPLIDKSLLTRAGATVGTPEYMSPEQADSRAQDVDTRSDVYSLGVLVYELLVGARPFEADELAEAGAEEIRRRIREEEPSRPSARISSIGDPRSAVTAERRRTSLPGLVRELRGDLDWIAMKALEKDRDRRYASAAELRADIERHLRHEPVEAGPPGWLYRGGKFARRHRVGIAAGTLVAVALLLGIGGMTVGYLRALRSERRATTEADTAREVSSFLVRLFEEGDPYHAKGAEVTVLEALDQGRTQLEGQLTDRPVVRARLLDALGRVYTHLGHVDTAEPLLEEALALQLESLGEDHLDTAATLVDLGRLHDVKGNRERQLELLGRGLAVREKLLGPDHLDLAKPLIYMAGEIPDQALELRQRALGIIERNLGEGHPETLGARGDVALSLGQSDLYEKNMAIADAGGFGDHPDLVPSLINLASILHRDGRTDEAQRMAERGYALCEAVYRGKHPYYSAAAPRVVAQIYRDTGQAEKALPMLERAYEVVGRPERNAVVQELGRTLLSVGRKDEAERLYRTEIERLGTASDRPFDRFDFEIGLAEVHLQDPGRAKATLSRAVDLLAARAEERYQLARYRFRPLSRALVALCAGGDCDDARSMGERLVAQVEERVGADHPNTVLAVAALGRVEAAAGRIDRASELLGRAAELGVNAFDPHDEMRIALFVEWSSAMLDAESYENAVRPTERIIELERVKHGTELHDHVVSTLWVLAGVHVVLGNTDAGLEVARRYTENVRQLLGEDSGEYAYGQAAVEFLTGNRDRAVELIGEAVRRGYWEEWLPTDRLFRGLAEHPGYAGALEDRGHGD